WLNISRFARSVPSSSTPLAMYAQWPGATFRCAASSKSNTFKADAGSDMTSPNLCAGIARDVRKTPIPPIAATYGLVAANFKNSRRASNEKCLFISDSSLQVNACADGAAQIAQLAPFFFSTCNIGVALRFTMTRQARVLVVLRDEHSVSFFALKLS